MTLNAWDNPDPYTNLKPIPICTGCHKRPWQLPEYSPAETGSDLAAEDYVWAEEGTLNRTNGHFYCTACYIRAGMPTDPGGWVAP